MEKKIATVHARMEPGLKKEVEQILKNIGLSESQAIQIFYKQISLKKGLPFALVQEEKDDSFEKRKTINSREEKNLEDEYIRGEIVIPDFLKQEGF